MRLLRFPSRGVRSRPSVVRPFRRSGWPRRRVVLVVEDDAASRDAAVAALAEAPDLVGVGVADAEAARAILRGVIPDALLLELRLPGTDGPAFLSDVRAAPETADLPVVGWTRGWPGETRAAGADGLGGDPLDVDELRAALREALAEE